MGRTLRDPVSISFRSPVLAVVCRLWTYHQTLAARILCTLSIRVSLRHRCLGRGLKLFSENHMDTLSMGLTSCHTEHDLDNAAYFNYYHK